MADWKPTLCLDFDGCVHLYTSPWTDEKTISDGPVPGAFEWLAKAVEVFDVQIYSSRSKSEAGRNAMRTWMADHALAVLGEAQAWHVMSQITFAFEKPAAFLTIDDRALCFNGDWSVFDLEVLRAFKPWNKQVPN